MTQDIPHTGEDDKIQRFADQLTKEVVILRTNMFIIKKILEFPWQILGLNLQFSTFLTCTFMYSADYSIIIIRKIYYDNGGEVTLPKLRGLVYQSEKDKGEIFVTEEKKDRIREIKQELNKYEARVNALRNNQLAHLSDIKKDFLKENVVIFKEIHLLVDLVTEYFLLLGKGEHKADDVSLYTHPRQSVPDIEKILNNVARESEFLNMKEDKPELWGRICEVLKSENKYDEYTKVFNHYRKLLYDKPAV